MKIHATSIEASIRSTRNSPSAFKYAYFNLCIWLLGGKSQLSIEKKLLSYEAILKAIWTYGIQLWDAVQTEK